MRLLDVIFFEGSSLPLLAFVLALLEPWQDDLMQCEDLPEAMDVLMGCPSLTVDVDDTMQKVFDLVGWTPIQKEVPEEEGKGERVPRRRMQSRQTRPRPLRPPAPAPAGSPPWAREAARRSPRGDPHTH